MSDYGSLPTNLVAPEADGAADHLVGKAVPFATFASTLGGTAALDSLPGRSIVYIYPMYKRLTLVIDEGRITHVFYPVFPPNESTAVTLAWLRATPVG